MLVALGYLDIERRDVGEQTLAESQLVPLIREIEWTPVMVQALAEMIENFARIARDFQGIPTAPDRAEDARNVTEAMREGPPE
jgi:hypothetical protein